MADMKALVGGAIGFVVAIVSLVVGVVITDKLSTTTGLGTNAQNVANNGTDLLGSILTDYGSVIVISLVLIAVLVPLLVALIALSRLQGGR